jgi:TP901 family phage tail tape measure protein
LGETLAFDAALNASNFLSGINQMVQGMNRVEQSGSSVSGGLAASLGQKGKFASVGASIGQDLTQSIGSQFGAAGNVASSLAMSLGPVGIAAGVAGAALIGAGVASVNLARAWETSMAGVSKTTGLTGSDLASLSSELQNMATTTPLAATELANIAAVAGSLGVAKQDIAGFTEAAAMMAVGFELPAEQAATSAAKILTAFGKPIDTSNMMALGNTVNTLGDNFAATEPEILDFVNRASYLNSTFGMGIPEVAAWGTALISVGVSSETAATGIKSMMNLSLDPKKFDAFAEAAGMSSEDLRESLNKDVAGTYEMIAEKIAGGSDAVEKFGTISKLVGTEGMTVFTKMGGAAYQSGEALKKANAEWENGSSLQKTFAAQSATLDSQWQIFTNTLSKAGTELGTVMLPALTEIVKGLTEATKAAMAFGEGLAEDISQVSEMTGIGQEGGFSAKLSEWTGGLLGLTVEQQAMVAAGEANEITAAEMATQTADVYSDYLGQGIAGHEGEIASALGHNLGGDAVTAAAEKAGEDTAKAFADSQEAYMKSHSSGGYSLETMEQMQSQASDTEYIADLYGTANIGGFDFILDKDNKLHLPDGGIESFTGSQDLADRLYSCIEDYTGAAMTDLEKAEIWGDIKSQVRLNSAVEVEVPEFLFDIAPAIENIKDIAPEVESNFKDFIGSIAANATSYGKGEMTKTGQAFIDALASSLSPESYGNLVNSFEQLKVEMGKGTEFIFDETEAARIVKAWKDKLTSEVADWGAVAKAEAENIGKQIASTLADSMVSDDDRLLYENLIPWLELIKEKVPEAFGEAGLDSILKFVEMAKNGASAAELATYFASLGKVAGEGYVSAMFGAMKEGFDNRNTLEQLSAGAIVDPKSWIANKFIPDLKKDFGAYNDQFKIGSDMSLKATDDWIEQLIKIHDKYSEFLPKWYNDLIEMKKQGDSVLTDKEFMDVLGGVLDTSTDKTTSATKKQGIGYDNLKKTIEDCADCAISEFGQWQEAQTDLFSPSWIVGSDNLGEYIKQKTQNIADIRATQENVARMGGVSVGKQYTGAEYDWADENKKELTVTANTAQADTAIALTQTNLTKLVADADKGAIMKLDTTAADKALDSLIASIQANMYQTIYVETVHYDSYEGAANGAGDAVASTQENLNKLIYDSYAEGTDYVPRTGPYLLHRGESVTPVGENRGGVSVTIGPTIIEGNVNGVDDFEERMDRRDAELLKKVNAALKSMAKAS